jgi:hypothetical protein
LLELTDEISEPLTSDIPNYPATTSSTSCSTQASGNIATMLHMFEHGTAPDQIAAPAAANEYAKRLAQCGCRLLKLIAARRHGWLNQAHCAELIRDHLSQQTTGSPHSNASTPTRRPPQPPAISTLSDIGVLFWNADTTRMTAALHRDFVELGMANALTRPGAATMLGTAIDLGRSATRLCVRLITNHICPWQSCYRTTRLLGGETRFVLSTSGHIASMVKPPGNPKATFQVNAENVADPEQWLRTATTVQSSWWPDYAAWLRERSGSLEAAPADLGGAGWSRSSPHPAATSSTPEHRRSRGSRAQPLVAAPDASPRSATAPRAVPRSARASVPEARRSASRRRPSRIRVGHGALYLLLPRPP